MTIFTVTYRRCLELVKLVNEPTQLVGFLIEAKIWAPRSYMIRFMQYKKLKPSNLTHIDAKTLVIDLTSILSIIPSLRDEKNDECRSHYQPRKKQT